MADLFDEQGEVQNELDGTEEDVKDYTAKAVNDHVIVLIDARRNMFESMADDGETYFDVAMKVTARLMKAKIIASSAHQVGVTLFGAKGKPDVQGDKTNVMVFLELAPPSAARIRNLEVLPRNEKGFDKKYGSLEEGELCPLRSGLLSCQSEFMTIKRPTDVKRIFIFTNDDDPLKGDKEERKKLGIIAKDLIEASIEIQLFHMKRESKGFDPNKFYREILTSDGDEFSEQALGNGAGMAAEFLDQVRRKEFKKRKLSQLPFYICEGLQGRKDETKISFDVAVYTLVYPAKRSNPIYLDARRNRPVQVISKYMDDKTGAQLDEHEIRRYLEFCGERAYVTPVEMAGIKALSLKGLVLLGFKEAATLRDDFNTRSPYFLYPDEESTTGSAKAFIALHSAMLEKGVYGLARFTSHDKASPRLVALLPQEEEVEDGLQTCPPGLHVLFLPFADEVRELKTSAVKEVKVEEAGTATEKGVPAAEALIQALQLDGLDCRRFDNPVLHRHYAALQAIALAEEEVAWEPDRDDNTRPDDEAIDVATAGLMEEIKEAFGSDQEDDVPVPGAKRPTPGGAKSGAGKRVKLEGKRVKLEEDSGNIDWKACVESGEVDRMLVNTLKAYLKAQGLATAGKKADLAQRVRAHVETS